MLGSLERQLRARSLDAAFRYQLALVANGSLSEESFSKSQESARERFFDLVGCWRPWEGKSYLHRKQAEFKDYRQQYIDAFGCDPHSPEFKAWEAGQIRQLEEGAFDPVDADLDAEELVTKRLQERILKE